MQLAAAIHKLPDGARWLLCGDFNIDAKLAASSDMFECLASGGGGATASGRRRRRRRRRRESSSTSSSSSSSSSSSPSSSSSSSRSTSLKNTSLKQKHNMKNKNKQKHIMSRYAPTTPTVHMRVSFAVHEPHLQGLAVDYMLSNMRLRSGCVRTDAWRVSDHYPIECSFSLSN
jgi:endonuclease/exonuclease/phosphatase family metal-dependent hydrolase